MKLYLTVLCVVAAESDQLLAYRTATVGLPLAHLGVLYHPLHLLAARQPAVCISALASMHQRLDASLYGQLPCLLQKNLFAHTPTHTIEDNS
jgi:hypothetical protein